MAVHHLVVLLVGQQEVVDAALGWQDGALGGYSGRIDGNIAIFVAEDVIDATGVAVLDDGLGLAVDTQGVAIEPTVVSVLVDEGLAIGLVLVGLDG